MKGIGLMVACGAVGLSLALGGCGTETSTFGEETAAGPGGRDTPEGTNGLAEIGPSGTASACVTDVQGAELAPTNLIFVYDKSGSMGDMANGGFDPKLKWIPVSSGIKDFFADPYSKTLRASLEFFPLSDNTIESACGHPYATPTVALTNASDPAFVTAIDGTSPSGGTPTLPALEGGIAYAKQIAADRPNDKTAVVLVTDGEPGFYDEGAGAFVPGCANNDVAHAAAAAKAAFSGTPSIPTYVIGVGPKLTALNAIASAGGTNAAVMVDVSAPSTTKATIVSSLAAIRKREVTCDFALPPPPPGKQLDTQAVNVVLKNADGTERVLVYSKDCKDAGGWRYDDPAAPKRVLLCDASCNDAKQAADGKVSLAFGCKTRVEVR